MLICYIFIDMLTGKKKFYCLVDRHFNSVSDYIQDILLSIFRSCFMCPYFDKCSLPFSLSEIPICAEKVNCWLKDWCKPICFIEYSSENLRTCFYIIQANILLSPEEFLSVSMVLESNVECTVPGLMYLVHMLKEFWYLCSDM